MLTWQLGDVEPALRSLDALDSLMSKTVPKGVYLETPDSVVANPQVYKGAYEKIQKLIQRGAGK